MTAPIQQVLTELGVEAEQCQNPVDAVERVTTQLFQIVITDWQDQPEAAFLLKTARDLKAAVRPLTLAIVSEENRPHALQAGANSVLLRPIRPEQVRETMSTACELLRAKLQTATPSANRSGFQPGAITAAGSSSAAAAPAPGLAIPTAEKSRVGQFLQSPTLRPGSQFDTASEIREPLEASREPVDSLTELEPMAAAVEEIPEAKPEPQEALTGWAALQARLTKTGPAAVKEVAAQSELLANGDPQAWEPSSAAMEERKLAPLEQAGINSDTASGFPAAGGPQEEISDPAPSMGAPRAKRGKIYLLAFAFISVALIAVPRSREALRGLSRTGARAALRWLNPPPPPLPQTVTQHDSFGQPDDEYKLPAAANIPDSTTDASKIEVVPVVDPTAKPDKSGVSNGTQTPAASGAGPAAGEPASAQSAPDQSSGAAAANVQSQNPAIPSAAAPTNPTAVNSASAAAGTAAAQSLSSTAPTQYAPVQPAPQAPPAVSQPAPAIPIRSSPPHAVPASEMAGIPSSLKSQIASTTPEMSGAKPDDGGASVIGPVALPESAVRALLAQAPAPEYPAGAKASGQRGSVILQVLIGPDGTVQDAKFMQGSFMFARSAIDAVKQWRFKPYSMNGRPVAVQSTITLDFKPSA